MHPFTLQPVIDVVCPNCSDAISAMGDFCERCGAPVGRFTTLDPCKAIYAEGWLFRKSISGRVRPIVLIGTWALFGLPLLGTIALALNGTYRAPAADHLYTLGICLIALPLLVRVTLNYIRNRNVTGPYDPGL